MPDVRVEPITRPFDVTLAPPGSKSLTNRALVLASLGRGRCTLHNILVADDTAVMIDGLRALGFGVDVDEARLSAVITGQEGRIPAGEGQLFCGNSGTTIRFLTAVCALGRGRYVLDGVERMRQRPIGELLGMLRGLGVRASGMIDDGFPPVAVSADGIPGGLLRHGRTQSSQYLSAILMVAPFMRHELRVNLEGEQTSWPYIEMTMRQMDQFGVTPELIRDPETGQPTTIIVPQWPYHATDYHIEPDASAASYFLAAAAIHAGSRITIPGLGTQSLQGDVRFAHLLGSMGAEVSISRDCISVRGGDGLHGIEADLSAMPDVAQTLAVAALFADGPTTLTGLGTLRVKETDRIAALATELARLGAKVDAGDDRLHIAPPRQVTPAAIATYDDHRMAMSFALAGTRCAGVTICDAQCVNKTYPGFFRDLARLSS